MRGCLVGLIARVVGGMLMILVNVIWILLLAALRVLWFLVMLMVTSTVSLFVGVNTAIDRITFSWIEQATGNGVMIGYNQASRSGLKVAAGLMIFIGWLLTIGTIYFIVTMFANQ